MKNIKKWVSAFRLRTIPLSISGIIIGFCFAYYNGFFDPIVLILAILLTISFQILSNLANDYGDGIKGTDNEKREGPIRAIQSGAITPTEMEEALKINILVILFLTVMLVMCAFGVKNVLYSFSFFILAGLSVYAAINYTVGDSPYGYRSLGDLFVFLFFGLLSVMGSYFLFTMQLDHHIILPSVALGLLCVGVLNLNNMRDIKSDRDSNKITVAVRLGLNNAKLYHTALIVMAMVVISFFVILYYSRLSNLLVLISFIPLIIQLVKVKKAKGAEEFDVLLKPLALTTFAFALLLGIGYIL